MTIWFSDTDPVNAANGEVAKVETAAIDYYADNNRVWPHDTNTIGADDSLRDGPGDAYYIDRDTVYNYHFDITGRVVVPNCTAWPDDATIAWEAATHRWVSGQLLALVRHNKIVAGVRSRT